MPKASKVPAASKRSASSPARSRSDGPKKSMSKSAAKSTVKAAQSQPGPKAGGRAPRRAAGGTKTAAAATKSTSTTRSQAGGKAATKTAAKAPVDRFLEEQRELLLAERATALHQADALLAEAEQLAQEMEPGDIQFDEESGEGATMNIERERDLALSAQARAAVEEIDRALAKIDAGVYGVCEQCGQPIPKARLKALPSAALCVGCKSGGLTRR